MAAEEMGEYCERLDANPKTKFLSNMLKGLKEKGVVYEKKAEKLDKQLHTCGFSFGSDTLGLFS